MKGLIAAVLTVALAASARAQSSLDAAFEMGRALRSAPSAAKMGREEPTAKAVLRFPAPPEAAAPDKYDDGNDDFRRALLDWKRSDRWFVPTGLGGVMLVIEKGYIDDARLDRLCADLREAVFAIPRLTGRPPLIRARFTVYVYDQGPSSKEDVPGLRPGERGLMLRTVKNDAEPLFHEMTHLLAGYSDSWSLGEGIADWVQARERPGRAYAFVPANTNPDAMAKAALARRPAAFGALIGAPGREINDNSDRDVRRDFYYCSWSFVSFLIRQGDMKAFWLVADAGGKPEAYQAAYGKSFTALHAAWIEELSRAAP